MKKSPLSGSILSFLPFLACAFAMPPETDFTGESLRGSSSVPPEGERLGGAAPLGGGSGPARLAPAMPGTTETHRRRQAQLAANVLREQAEKKAAAESARTGRTVEAEKTPTVDEILSNPDVASDPQFSRGPETQELRPGESLTGAPSGVLAKARPVPEHLVSQANIIPTTNAPGLGADTGFKLTPDNLDARGGSGHDNGPDPADPVKTAANPNAFTGIPGVHSEERDDTVEKNRERIRSEQESGPAADLQAKADENVARQTEANRSGAGPSGETETGSR